MEAISGIGALFKNAGAFSPGPQEGASAPSGLTTTNSMMDALNAWQSPQEQPDMSSPAQQQQFVKDVYPAAQDAASKLGVDPHVLVAQAALETGWATGINRNSDGTSSNNYFNIKADKSWQGPTTQTATHEVINGQRVAQTDAFRAYSNAKASFDDFVKFLQSNPRYKAALAATGDPQQFAAELQKAGYATDPDYASKIVATARHIQQLTGAGNATGTR